MKFEKLTCKKLIAFLDDYLDGSLDPKARAVFDEHLQHCPPCIDYLKEYQATVKLGKCLCDKEKGEDAPVPRHVPDHLITAAIEALKHECKCPKVPAEEDNA